MKQDKGRKKYLSTYYDTRQHLLRDRKVTLRVRDIDGVLEQTIKVPQANLGGVVNFAEWTVPLETAKPDLSRFDASVVARINQPKRRINLRPLFTTEIERTVVLLEREKSLFELALDTGRIISHGKTPRSEPVCEIELELVRGSPLAMFDLALELNQEFGLHPEHRTKAQRGYALLRSSLKAKPTKASKVALEPGTTAGHAFQQIMSNALDQLFNNEIPTIEGKPGGIHQARVSIRRIRAALRAFKKCLPYDKRKAFNGEFRWFQLRLARPRDWHVFLTETVPNIQNCKPNARVNLARLQKLALAERRRATADARELFKSKRYTRLLLQFQRWLLTLQNENNRWLHTDVTDFSASVLKKTRRDFLLDTRPLSRMTIDEVHDLRKRGKKARYATEFFASLHDDASLDPYLKLMKELQGLLGEVNDAAVARQAIASVPPGSLKSSTIALVQDWSELQYRNCIRGAQIPWRKFQKLEPRWGIDRA